MGRAMPPLRPGGCGPRAEIANSVLEGAAMPVSRLLIIFGLALVALGLLWPFIAKLGLGRLPGDIVIERENFRLYLPLTSSLLVSAVLSLILWFINR